jgi:flagellar hook-basal body complex protein FliE
MIDLLSRIASSTNTTAVQRPQLDGITKPATSPGGVGDKDFSALIGEAIDGMAGQLRKAEVVSIGAVEGTASAQDVVEQVMLAEQSLQSAIAVRDKIVAAYLEIGRMAI